MCQNNDDFDQEHESILQKLDPRIKMAFILVALAIDVMTQRVIIPAGVLVFCLAILIVTGTDLKYALKRMLPALGIAIVILITQIFFYEGTPLFTLPVFHYQLVGTVEGLQHGLLLMMRVLGGISLILFLTLTSTVEQLIFAASWFRLPHPLIEIITIAYRYIFIFLEELDRLKKAQQMRLGYSSWRKSIQSVSNIGGIIIVKVFDKSEMLYTSMRSRGYQGDIVVTYDQRLSRTDLVAGALMVVFLGVEIVLSL